MKLATALAVAKQNMNPRELIIYRAKNGQYMTAQRDNPCTYGRPIWTYAEFIKEFENEK